MVLTSTTKLVGHYIGFIEPMRGLLNSKLDLPHKNE